MSEDQKDITNDNEFDSVEDSFFDDLISENDDLIQKYSQELNKKEDQIKKDFSRFTQTLVTDIANDVALKTVPIYAFVTIAENVISAAWTLWNTSEKNQVKRHKAKFDIFLALMQAIPVIGSISKKILPKFIRPRNSKKPEFFDAYLLETLQFFINQYTPHGEVPQNAKTLLETYVSVAGVNKILDKIDLYIKERLHNKDDWIPDFVWEAAEDVKSFVRRHLVDIMKFVEASVIICIAASLKRAGKKLTLAFAKRKIKQLGKELITTHLTGGVGEHIGDYAILENNTSLLSNWNARGFGSSPENDHGAWKENPINNITVAGKLSNTSKMHRLKAVSGHNGIDSMFRTEVGKYIVAEYKASLTQEMPALRKSLASKLKQGQKKNDYQLSRNWILSRLNTVSSNTTLTAELALDKHQIGIRCTPLAVLISFKTPTSKSKLYRSARIHLAMAYVQMLDAFTGQEKDIEKVSKSEKNSLANSSNISYGWHMMHNKHSYGFKNVAATDSDIQTVDIRTVFPNW